ncbi:MAG: CPCC family cysteine-rich protein [Planctomycetaceae bacterium]
MKYTCFICGYKTLENRCDWDICPICFWMDNLLVTDEKDMNSGGSGNHGVTVVQAQANFMLFGASSERDRDSVRPPLPTDEKDPEWSPFYQALQLYEQMKAATE